MMGVFGMLALMVVTNLFPSGVFQLADVHQHGC
jgi:hypothetical protein